MRNVHITMYLNYAVGEINSFPSHAPCTMPCLDTIFYEELKFAIYIFDYKNIRL